MLDISYKLLAKNGGTVQMAQIQVDYNFHFNLMPHPMTQKLIFDNKF